MPPKTRALLPLALVISLVLPTNVAAHSGGTNSRGCHEQNGVTHCHNGGAGSVTENTNTIQGGNGVTVTTSTVQGSVGLNTPRPAAPAAQDPSPVPGQAPGVAMPAATAPSGPPPLAAPSNAGTPMGAIKIDPLSYEDYEQNPVANPLPTARPDLVGPPEGTAFVASEWPSDTGPGALVVPARWIWERGGWAYDGATRALKTSDPFLQRAALSTPGGWIPRGGEGVAGWLPEGPSACAAMARIEQALTIHRLAMDVEERQDWRRLKQESCPRTLPLR